MCVKLLQNFKIVSECKKVVFLLLNILGYINVLHCFLCGVSGDEYVSKHDLHSKYKTVFVSDKINEQKPQTSNLDVFVTICQMKYLSLCLCLVRNWFK